LKKKHFSNPVHKLCEGKEDANPKQTSKSKKIADYFAGGPRINVVNEPKPPTSEWDPIIKRKES
jgi:hypothetical protein